MTSDTNVWAHSMRNCSALSIQGLSYVSEPVPSLDNRRAITMVDGDLLEIAEVNHEGSILAAQTIRDVAMPTTTCRDLLLK